MKIKEIEQDLRYEGTELVISTEAIRSLPRDIINESWNETDDTLVVKVKDLNHYRRIVSGLNEQNYSIRDNGKIYYVIGDFAEKAAS